MSEPSETGGVVVPDDTSPTQPIPPVGPAPGVSGDEAIFAALAGGEPMGGDDAWPARPRRSGVRLRAPLLVLLALIVAAGAFWGGAAVQRANGTSSSGLSSAAASRIAAFLGRGSGSSRAAGNSNAGGSGFPGVSAPAARGTVTAVVGHTLYLTSPTGTIVKVQIPSTATIALNSKATAASLKSGDTVVVEGSTSTSGIVTATSVSASAPGVASGARAAFGGFGGNAGGLGGTGRGGSGG